MTADAKLLRPQFRTRRPALPAQRRPYEESRARETPRPFVKWVGGKTQLLSSLLPLVPEKFGAYHEPFTGGGALFFALVRTGLLRDRPAFLSDVNAELIATYLALQDRVEEVIEALEQHRYDRDHFYRVRAVDPSKLDDASLAARLIFLNRTGFNGLYRVNRRGEFNVPFGRYDNPTICDTENLRAVSEALQCATIEHRPFDSVLEHAKRGDFVYFDPPYVPLSATASFVSYAQNGFDLDAQEHLACVFDTLAARGVHVMLSNSDTPWVRDRYRAHPIIEVTARRNVNSKAGDRGPIGELLVATRSLAEL